MFCMSSTELAGAAGMYSELLFSPPPVILCTSSAFQLGQGFYQLQQAAAPLALLLVPCVVE